MRSRRKNKPARKCATRHCRNIPAPSNGGRYCYTCQSRAYRRRRPAMAAFHNLKSHATARGKVFSITFAQFCRVAGIAKYLDEKGNERTALHVDRKDPRRGYEPGNLQILTNADNARKAALERRAAYGECKKRGLPVSAIFGRAEMGVAA